MIDQDETPQVLIGERLADAISKERVRQAGLARHMGLSQAAVSKWVHGKAGKEWVKLGKICAYLKVPADEILGLKPPAPPALIESRSPVRWQCPCCGATLTTTVADG